MWLYFFGSQQCVYVVPQYKYESEWVNYGKARCTVKNKFYVHIAILSVWSSALMLLVKIFPRRTIIENLCYFVVSWENW